ncbi:MAG: hypothetical protein H6895_12630 [Defluviimonas sp.]|uniref:hypothetical protein n=1 Tax=Albidovulum sp. TaxID=1872424 RepID=UPI002A350A5E|nr:hypothetical protein [Defluviimonas sp.]
MTVVSEQTSPATPIAWKVREALVLAYARKLERAGRGTGGLGPPDRAIPMLSLLADALGAIALGFLAANFSILLVFIVMNFLLHM